MLNFNKINVYHVGKFVYNVYHGIVPDMFEDMFVSLSWHKNFWSFTSPNNFLNLSQNSIRYHGTIIWNKISTAAINPDSSEVSFQIILKKGTQQEVITQSYSIKNIAIANYLFLHNPALSPFTGKMWTIYELCTREWSKYSS